jgi:hypothetical protein
MTHKTSQKYPWHRLQRGEYFFVPALDLPATELAGLRVAARQGLGSVKAYPCIYKGMLGVMFKR